MRTNIEKELKEITADGQGAALTDFYFPHSLPEGGLIHPPGWFEARAMLPTTVQVKKLWTPRLMGLDPAVWRVVQRNTDGGLSYARLDNTRSSLLGKTWLWPLASITQTGDEDYELILEAILKNKGSKWSQVKVGVSLKTNDGSIIEVNR